MVERLADGLWWLHGTRGSNVFLVEADDGQLALVDCGFASSAAAIERELASLASGRPLSAILLTHRHSDHAGAAEAVRKATGASVIAGRADCTASDEGMVLFPTLGRSHFGRRFRMIGGQPLAIPVANAIENPTDVLPGIRAVPTPGHTPGSVCFVVDRLGAAFVGDLVISHSGTLTRSMRSANHDDPQYLESIRAFANIAPGIGLPGHGSPLMAGFGDALRALAALPRRKSSPRIVAGRVVRMATFTRGMVRRRKAYRP